jgi:hypothetical protein
VVSKCLLPVLVRSLCAPLLVMNDWLLLGAMHGGTAGAGAAARTMFEGGGGRAFRESPLKTG